MSLFKVLPGIELPVREVSPTLSEMWAVDREGSGEFRASQMNLILHFGIKTTEEEAQERFQTAVRFGQRYPCRIIVLCPRTEDSNSWEMLSAKLFTQCYIGDSLREMCCCEALMLSYNTREFVHLRNQVSVWLEADLPTVHWFHQVPADRIQNQYLSFIYSFRRILFDRAVEGEAYDGIAWPRPNRVVDITSARLLPIKQSLGPFLAGFSPEELIEGLEAIHFWVHSDFQGEGKQLRDWVFSCLEHCFSEKEEAKRITLKTHDSDDESTCLRMRWKRAEGNLLEWQVNPEGQVHIEAHFRNQALSRNQFIEWISPEMELSESIFF